MSKFSAFFYASSIGGIVIWTVFSVIDVIKGDIASLIISVLLLLFNVFILFMQAWSDGYLFKDKESGE